MPRLIANMVARNEASEYLPEVLERLRNQVDVIVFTDDASTDDTVKVAEQYVDHIMVMDEPTFCVHEGDLRQASWNFLESSAAPVDGDWVLAIDADEFLYETKKSARELIQTQDYTIINVDFYHMWNETHFRVDGGWRPHGSTRLFKWRPGGIFKSSKVACGSEPTFVASDLVYFRHLFMADSGLKMKHLSYIKDADKKKKYDRYTEIDGGKFHANSHINSIIDPPGKVSLELWTQK